MRRDRERRVRRLGGALACAVVAGVVGTGCEISVGRSVVPDAASVHTGRDSGYPTDTPFIPDNAIFDPPIGDAGCGGATRDAMPLAFGATTSAENAPPPISGGTLAVSRDQSTGIAADPDHDAVWLVDLAGRTVRQRVALHAGDEPGRMVEDASQVVHVVLRRGGAVADVALVTGTVIARRSVCAAPRGIDFDASTGNLYVACVDGTLVSLPSAGTGPAVAIPLHGFSDLRDVAVDPATHHVFVSQFRAATLLEVDPTTGAVVSQPIIPQMPAAGGALAPDVAWRMILSPQTHDPVVLHQFALTTTVCPAPGGYGGGEAGRMSGPIVQAAVSGTTGWPNAAPATPGILQSTVLGVTSGLPPTVLAVDVAIAPTGERAFAAAGAGAGNGFAAVTRFAANGTTLPSLGPQSTGGGQVVAVAYTTTGVLVMQTRNPAALVVESTAGGAVFNAVAFDVPSIADTGHVVFHTATGGGLACAGCHPEGGDDGHVWDFTGLGLRRTQNLRGGTTVLAPFHWDGRFPTLTSLMADVYQGRMNGPSLAPEQLAAVQHWVDAIPDVAHAPPADPIAVERGRFVFADATVGCVNCHSGPRLTNNSLQNVGTGEVVKVPSLTGVAFRAPYLHTGCAATLRDRFDLTGCGGGDAHGHTSQLSGAQVDDLITYLQTL